MKEKDWAKEAINGRRNSRRSLKLRSTTIFWSVFFFFFWKKLLRIQLQFACLTWNIIVIYGVLVGLIVYWQSKEECEYLINLAKPRLVRALVTDRETGRGVESRFLSLSTISSPTTRIFDATKHNDLRTFCSARTSYGAFLSRGGDRVVRAIEQRIADYTKIPIGTVLVFLHFSTIRKVVQFILFFLSNCAPMLPQENGEGMQVLHYSVGQKHDPHFDYSTTRLNENGGPRMATLLMYL